MDATPRLQLPYIAPQQAQKQVTYNEAMRTLDLLVQPAVKSLSLTAPPANPAEGDSYAVAAGATGAWAGQDGKVATLRDGGWVFRAAQDGWQLYVEDTAALVIRRAGAWEPLGSAGGSVVDQFGINATPNGVERLAIASEASLFSHDGAGHRLKLNKAQSGDTASMLFQTGFSGRAELGLAGDDDFHVKVSPDGTNWLEALAVARDTGAVRLPRGQLAFPATQNPSADPNTLDDYEEGTFTPVVVGTTSAGVGTYSANNGEYTKIGNVVIFTIYINMSAHTGTGNMRVSGLPFVASMSGDFPTNTYLSNIAFNGQVTSRVSANNTECRLLAMSSGDPSSEIAMDSSCVVSITGFYLV